METVEPLAFDRNLAFGPFRLFPSRQLLLKANRPIQIGTRAFAILELLADRAGDVVSKEELIAHVWPDTFVQEGNVKVHVAAVRRVLGDGQFGNQYIVTIPGRGYRFVGAVSVSSTSALAAVDEQPLSDRHNLPTRLTSMLGREQIVSAINEQILTDRFVSIVGPGGIGKTTVAVAAAGALSNRCRDGCRFVDMAPLSEPRLLPSALALLLGITVNSDDPLPQLLAFLADKNILILLDSCEHMVSAAADLSERLLKGARGVHILATSREPLRAASEVVRRLPPLAIPTQFVPLTAAQAMIYPAIQLFVERASASVNDFTMTDVDALFVADICRRLDGNPLAIELAAGRVDAFGIRGVAAGLEDRFQLLTSGRRTAVPRHKTLAATIDWSYELLSQEERAVLRGLSIFSGDFTLDAAAAVTACGSLTESQVVDCIANLAARSLVAVDVTGTHPRYRLLDTMRAYGRVKLCENNEQDPVARRHAEYFRALLEREGGETCSLSSADWRRLHGPQVDDVRAALDWAFSLKENDSLGLGLTIAAVPLWLNLSLMDECRHRITGALSRVSEGSAATPIQKLKLLAALGVALYSIGPGPESKRVWMQAMRIASRLKNTDYRLRALWGMWTVRVTGGKHRGGLRLANKFLRLARQVADPAARRVGERLVGTSRHFLGDQQAARRSIDNMLRRAPAPGSPSDIVRFQFDQAIVARAFLSKILWLEGNPARAMQEAHQSVADAESIGHSLSLCYALGQGACPVAFLTGDLAAAERWVPMLLDHSIRHGVALWATMGRGFDAMLRIKRGDDLDGVRRLRAAIDELHEAHFTLYHTFFLGELAQALGCANQLTQGLSTIDAALAQSKRNEERWCVPELLRVKAGLLSQRSPRGASKSSESYLQRSINMARRHGSLSWELRSTITLARLRRARNSRTDVRALLAPIYGRFSHSFKTADLDAARQLLAD